MHSPAHQNIATLVAAGMVKAADMGLIRDKATFNAALQVCIDEAFAYLKQRAA